MRNHDPKNCPDRYARDGKVYCPHTEDTGKVVL